MWKGSKMQGMLLCKVVLFSAGINTDAVVHICHHFKNICVLKYKNMGQFKTNIQLPFQK